MKRSEDLLSKMIMQFMINPDIHGLQHSLAEHYEEATGRKPTGQLWQECEVEGCHEEPVCMNCMCCQKSHCKCSSLS